MPAACSRTLGPSEVWGYAEKRTRSLNLLQILDFFAFARLFKAYERKRTAGKLPVHLKEHEPTGEAGEQQAAEEAPEQPSVWTPEGGAEPTEAPADSSTNENEGSAAAAAAAVAAAGGEDFKAGEQGGGQSDNRQKNGSDHHGHTSYFVGGLHPEITRAELEEYLSAYVPVEEIDIKIDASTGRNRGYAFISVRPPFDAEAFVNAQHTMRDKPIDIRELCSKPSAERQPEKQPERRMSSSNANRHKIFIGGITPSITDEILYQHFEQFGSIEKANVIRDATGKSRGFGFVQFTSIESVAVAVEASPHQLDPDNRVDAQPAQDRAARRPLPGTAFTTSPYYDQGYYGYGYGGAAAAGPYGYHQSAAAPSYPPVYSASPYGAYGSGYAGGPYYAGSYGDAYGLSEGASTGYAAVRRGDEGSSSYSSRSVRGAPY
ncbi:hypothetical protein Emag_004856 [Eimeria magna]